MTAPPAKEPSQLSKDWNNSVLVGLLGGLAMSLYFLWQYMG